MSEVNQTNESAENQPSMVDVIMPSAIVEIKMSTGYYQKVQAIVGFFVKGKSPEQMQDAHAQIKDQNITEEWVIQSVTLEEAQKLIGETED
jgi:hypothetical protein